ncbi:YgjV family protein [Alteromonas oceanisediminis]|uniref:YgjV family protein n=1 Tax=Alteromonas oceanisediminis TaxID=2836180 RepID=UPI001BDAA3E3|nr:YgjV family protein [Alteromonas oceanisediminis]MBT0585886.1 YgjV family protein [Alteromonas oceanisediminis]
MVLVAEALGAAAVIFNFIGYRQNNVNRYLVISAAALACLSVHFFMLGAMAAGIGTALASIRNVIATRYRHRSILYLFVGLNIAFFCYEYFWLDHGAMIMVAYASSLVFTVGSIVLQDANLIRRWFILAEVLGLIYAISVGSIFGSIFNISNLISIGSKLWQEHRLQLLREKADR